MEPSSYEVVNEKLMPVYRSLVVIPYLSYYVDCLTAQRVEVETLIGAGYPKDRREKVSLIVNVDNTEKYQIKPGCEGLIEDMMSMFFMSGVFGMWENYMKPANLLRKVLCENFNIEANLGCFNNQMLTEFVDEECLYFGLKEEFSTRVDYYHVCMIDVAKFRRRFGIDLYDETVWKKTSDALKMLVFDIAGLTSEESVVELEKGPVKLPEKIQSMLIEAETLIVRGIDGLDSEF